MFYSLIFSTTYIILFPVDTSGIRFLELKIKEIMKWPTWIWRSKCELSAIVVNPFTH